MPDAFWIALLIAAVGCICYLGIQLYISQRVIKTLQQTAIIVTPSAKKKSKAGTLLLQALLIAGAILALLNLVLR